MNRIKHLKTALAFLLMRLPMPGRKRYLLARWGGVVVQGKSCFIGEGVIFDTLHPENIVLGDHIHITARCVLLTHYLDTSTGAVRWQTGRIVIGRDVFIGVGTIICRPVTIGEGAVVGAGSVVTRDIPPHQIWAGNPARYLKDRSREVR